MNKYQKALERICNNLLCGGECAVGCKPCSLLEPIQELVEKATPMKPITKVVKGSYDPVYFHYCPVCNFFSVEKDYANFCPGCGQKLDWSDI